MIAELVTTVARLALSPSVAAESASLRVEREARLADLAPRRAVGDQLGEPGLAAAAEPDQPLDVERQPGVERLQAPLGPELEERVGLQARLLGLAVLAGAGGGLHAVERERDQVVVRLVGRLLSRPRASPPRRRLGAAGERLDLLGGGDAVGRARCAWSTSAPSRSRSARAAAVRAASRLASWSCRSASAARAPPWNATASWISKSFVTRPSLTPRPYSTGTSARNRSSCWARRAASSPVSGAAVKPSSGRRAARAGARVTARRVGPSRAARRASAANAACALARRRPRRGPRRSAAARIAK